MRIIAFYLPQFHAIPENDAWWGKGFTEWVNVKKAKKLYEGHYQPRIPLNNNYYDLLNNQTIEWQSKLAEEYGIHGFCFYHYWFKGKKLLEKPIELYLKNDNCKTNYCICWANENWTNSWVSENSRILMKQEYGEKEDWIEHFEYLLPFFKDKRYIINNKKPLLVIYNPQNIYKLEEMLELWNNLAVINGFDGLEYASQSTIFRLSNDKNKKLFNYLIDYHPQFAYTLLKQKHNYYLRKLKRTISTFTMKIFGIEIFHSIKTNSTLEKYSYDEIWNIILNMFPESSKVIPGSFVDWDNTPRKSMKGFVIDGATPDKFENYLTNQLKRADTIYSNDMIFLFAWNEWAEGGYIEPDEKYGFRYLNAIKSALNKYKN